MSQLDLLLYPELRALGEQERERALRHARRTPFDLAELAGMAVAVVLVTSATRYGIRHDFLGEALTGLAGFLAAIPLWCLAVCPLLYRRTRRGLHKVLRQHAGHANESWLNSRPKSEEKR
jgi:hypothetical protein